MNLKGTKIVEVPYGVSNIEVDSDILIVGERMGGDGISKSIVDKGCESVTTTDIRPIPDESWIKQNTDWNHIVTDFIDFDTSNKYDRIISISVFEHFGLYWEGQSMYGDGTKQDIIHWEHDILGIQKSCELLKDENSKVVITLPVGNFFNYNNEGKPIVRYYTKQRQDIIRNKIKDMGCFISDENFFFSKNFQDWFVVDSSINEPQNMSYHNLYTPNVIWAFTINKK